MALHSFTLTRGGEDFTVYVQAVAMDMIAATIVCTYESSWPTPFGDASRQKDGTFDAAAVGAALTALGEQSYSNLGGMKTSMDALAEQLAVAKWGD